MKKKPITEFEPVELARLQPFLDCIGPLNPGGSMPDWWFGMYSTRTVVYGSGRIALEGKPVRHKVDPAELKFCRSFAEEAERKGGIFLTSEGAATWHRFFVAADVNAPAPERIDEALIRDRFGGAILPVVKIGVQPLDETAAWWSKTMDRLNDDIKKEAKERGLKVNDWVERATTLARSLTESGRASSQKAVEKAGGEDAKTETFRAICKNLELGRRFAGEHFRDSAYVEIGNYYKDKEVPPRQWPPGLASWPSQFPRLIVGLTHAGSLTGLITYVVYT